MQVFTLLSRFSIWNACVRFYVTKCWFPTSINIHVFTNEPGMKYKIYGVMWQVVCESKIKLVSCDMSPKSLLGISTLEDIPAIYWYIFCDSLFSLLFYDVLYISLICVHEFKDFLCSSELSYPMYLVSKFFRWNDPLVHIWSMYLVSYFYIYDAYCHICVNWRVFYYSLFSFTFVSMIFSWVITSTVTSPWLGNFSQCFLLNFPNSNNQLSSQI